MDTGLCCSAYNIYGFAEVRGCPYLWSRKCTHYNRPGAGTLSVLWRLSTSVSVH